MTLLSRVHVSINCHKTVNAFSKLNVNFTCLFIETHGLTVCLSACLEQAFKHIIISMKTLTYIYKFYFHVVILVSDA